MLDHKAHSAPNLFSPRSSTTTNTQDHYANLKTVNPHHHSHAENEDHHHHHKTQDEYKQDMEQLRRVNSKSINQLQDQMKAVKHVVQYDPNKEHTLREHCHEGSTNRLKTPSSSNLRNY